MTLALDSFWRRLRHTRFRDAMRGRIDGRLDWRQIITDASLPTEITAAITQVVKRSRLWKSERVDVAEELVAHFQDGIEAGTAVQQLLASFGDADVAARLVRRAKKRGRPLAWQVWHYGWLSLAALLLVNLFAGLYMMTGRPAIKTDYLAVINERAKSVPEAERAWPLYREALLAMGVRGVPGESDFADVIPDSDAKPGDADWPELEQFLHDHADSLAKLRTAAGRPNLGFVTSNSFVAFSPEDRELFGVSVTNEQIKAFQSQTVADRWLISTLLPELHQLKTAALLLASDARRAALAGDAETALADVTALLGVSRHSEEKPFLVNLLVANAVEKICYVAIQDTLVAYPQLWSDEELRDLAHRIAASPIDWRRGFTGETSCFHDAMQRFYTDNGHGDGRLAYKISPFDNLFSMLDEVTSQGPHVVSIWSNDGAAMLALPAANLVVASRKDMTATYERYISWAMTKISTPLWEQQDLSLPEEEFLSDKAGPIDRYRYLFVRLLVPANDKLRNNVATSEGERNGVLVGLALEVYRREHEAWPKTLAELSPRWLPDVPVDRITGKPLGYKIIDDRPVVYSVGVDRDDDGGRVPRGDAGNPDADLASPNQFQTEPVPLLSTSNAMHDGDWVIWSGVTTEKVKKTKVN